MVDLMGFIRNAKIGSELFVGMRLDNAMTFLGEYSDRIGDENSGYISYKELRIGFFGNRIDEIAIVYDENSIEYIVDGLYGPVSITSKTQIHEFIQILNFNKIQWKSHNESDLDYLYLKTQSGVTIIFDLDTGILNKVTFAG